MFTIIAATNRLGSNTLKVAKEYQRLFKENQVDAQLFSLEEMVSLHRDDSFIQLENKYLLPTEKYIFIMPEYNGSFPGIFKLMMDNSDITKTFYFKKVMLVGVANGRAGNLRGIDIMTNMCHYMKMNVFYNKLPISNVSNELKEDRFHTEQTIKTITAQIQGFINY
ncbi:MAG: NAD(P)H-dependent oxidoreductase [Chitinophagaceae bacterium]|nr:NAD(P)H-dependent oxidoreductase [Chitinophagaceae bacterium]